MPNKYSEYSLIGFQKSLPNNEACEKHLAQQRWPNGFICPKCNHNEAWYLANRKLFDCKSCRFQTSLIVGTVFEGSKILLIKWYWLLYHMAMDKVGVSISEMQRILEIGQYRTAWLMAHKIRKAMADRDARYNLAGLIEMDETFFGPKGNTQGRGSERKCIVLCAVSLYKDRTGEDRPGFAHMQIVEDASTNAIENFLDRLGCGVKTVEGQKLLQTIRTDGWRAYAKAAKNKGLQHYKVVLKDPRAAGTLLPWVHRVISNVKSVIRGTHRGVSAKHLQSYLSEICYRFNRRFWEKELFDRLVQACISTDTLTYKELVHGDMLQNNY